MGGRLDGRADPRDRPEPAGRDAVQIVLEHRSLPMCFDFLPNLPAEQGLVLTSSSELALLRLSADGTLARYADLSALSPYACNDIVIDGRGNIYVNNVNFDFAEGIPAVTRHPGSLPWSPRKAAPGWSPTTWRFPTGWPSPRTAPRWSSPSRTGTG